LLYRGGRFAEVTLHFNQNKHLIHDNSKTVRFKITIKCLK
jgi:hypothetical protein